MKSKKSFKNYLAKLSVLTRSTDETGALRASFASLTPVATRTATVASTFLLASALVLAATLLPSISRAADDSGILLDVGFLPVMGTTTDTDSATEAPGVQPEVTSGANIKATIGYVFSPQIFVGLTYDYATQTAARTAVKDGSESLDEKITRTEMGPTIGYLHNGWRFLATYFMSGKQDRDVVNKNADGSVSGQFNFSYTGFSGFQVAVGYTYAFNKYFALGSTLYYRNVSYSKQAKVNALQPVETYSETTLYTAKAESSLSPVLSLEFRF